MPPLEGGGVAAGRASAVLTQIFEEKEAAAGRAHEER